MFKSGFASVIGRPNVGKSTFLNSLIGQKISATSNKAQTTRNLINFIYTSDNMQVVFLDTPGIQKPKNKLGDYMLKISESALKDVDLITYIVDCSRSIGRLDGYIIDKLKEVKNVPIILLINKIDEIKKEELFELIKLYSDYGIFKEIIPISALKNDGIDNYLDTLYKYLKEGPQFYPEDMVTDKPERFIVAELIREKALRLLDEEVPHGIAVSVDKMQYRTDKDLVDIYATIYVERDSHKKIVIGKSGSMIKEIGIKSRIELEAFLDIKVNLKLWVKVKEKWREKESGLGSFGYKL
ncbi:GTPase Era [Peptoniphilus catoniae]|uniref:GTPase Era n=1 Tax=Peptoniphilus catoniae TaxID=1660341 RepID=UPI0010FD03A4|nr:GTPase Era [Peptoniphilus catoniae]